MTPDLTKLTHVEVAELWKRRDQIFSLAEAELKDNQAIDSAGIAFLVQWAKSKPEHKLVVRHASDTVRALIKTFRLESLFDMQDSVTA